MMVKWFAETCLKHATDVLEACHSMLGVCCKIILIYDSKCKPGSRWFYVDPCVVKFGKNKCL